MSLALSLAEARVTVAADTSRLDPGIRKGMGKFRQELSKTIAFTDREFDLFRRKNLEGIISDEMFGRISGIRSTLSDLGTLRKAFESGAISAETYEKAIKDIPVALRSVRAQAPSLPQIAPISPALDVDSAEVRRRIEEQMGSILPRTIRPRAALDIEDITPVSTKSIMGIKDLDAALGKAGSSAITMGERFRTLKTDMLRFGRGIPVLRGQMMSLVRTMGFFTGVAVFGGMIRAGEEFNRKMNQSLSIMKANENISMEMRRVMEETALQVARVTKFSAAEAAEAYFFLASAGLNAAQSLKALPQVAKFAQAGNFDLAKATELATDAQAAMGMHVKDPIKNLENLTRITDVLVKANTLADATTEQFALSMTRKSAAAARIVGKDVEELVAVLAALANQGTKSFNAGQAINIIFRDMQTKAIKNAAAWEKHKIAVFDDAKEMRNTADIIGDLEKALSGLGDEQKKLLLMELGLQDKSIIFVQTLIGMSKQIREFEKATRSAGGTTKKVADAQLTPTQKALARLGATSTILGKIIVDTMVPALANLTSGLVLVFNKSKAYLPMILKLGMALGIATLAIKGVSLALITYSTIAKAATQVTLFLQGAAGGVGAIIQLGVGLAAATSAIHLMNKELEDIGNVFAKDQSEIDKMTESIGMMEGSITNLGDASSDVDSLSDSFNKFGEEIETTSDALREMLPLIGAIEATFPDFILAPQMTDFNTQVKESAKSFEQLLDQSEQFNMSLSDAARSLFKSESQKKLSDQKFRAEMGRAGPKHPCRRETL